ncbi:MAG: zinc-dependent peptidase [Armatimonadetes bacterium]|nr:zinc-dependent peptidase [Armatimonadota bacterium]
MFDFFKNRRRDTIIRETFPAEWLDYIRRNVSHFAVLSETERAQLLDDLRVFRAEKSWEGAGGLVLTNEITVTISALACLLTLGLPNHNDYFREVSAIIVYPAGYRVTETRQANPAGVLQTGESWRLGEAWRGGPVVLSWADAKAGGTGAAGGSNVVLHEFAHKLDMEDGTAEGTPVLHGAAQYDEWHRVMSAAYARLRARLYWRYRGMDDDLVLDAYGATDAAEFFAVATEAFFERPRALRRCWRDLYAVLQGYYRQDPAARTVRFLRGVARAERPLWRGD